MDRRLLANAMRWWRGDDSLPSGLTYIVRMSFDYPARISRLQEALAEESIEVAVVGVGADLRYLIGYEGKPSERLTALVVGPGIDPVVFVPRLEEPLVTGGEFEIRPWDETEEPVSLAATLASSPTRVAAGDHLWSVFLMEFLEEWPRAEFVPASVITGRLRVRKEPAEIELLRQAGRAVDRVMEMISSQVSFAGRSEREVARDLSDLTVSEGHDLSEFTIVGSGPNSASPHHDPGGRIIEEGDLVLCDFGGRLSGYFSDSTRTFVVGEPSDEHLEVHSVVLEANRRGREVVEAGRSCESVDRSVRTIIEEAGFGEHFVHRTGHGIGLEVHEHPYIVEGNGTSLEVGMCFSIEPGVYLPERFGVRIEDIVVCTDDGAEALNNSTRSLVAVA